MSECNRRSRNECPCPARNGAIPLERVGDELTVEATHSLLSSEMSSELFIMLAREKGSQDGLDHHPLRQRGDTTGRRNESAIAN